MRVHWKHWKVVTFRDLFNIFSLAQTTNQWSGLNYFLNECAQLSPTSLKFAPHEALSLDPPLMTLPLLCWDQLLISGAKSTSSNSPRSVVNKYSMKNVRAITRGPSCFSRPDAFQNKIYWHPKGQRQKKISGYLKSCDLKVKWWPKKISNNINRCVFTSWTQWPSVSVCLVSVTS